MVVDTLEELMPAAMDKARELCRRGPLVLRYLKACMNEQEDFQIHRKDELEVTYTRYMASSCGFQGGCFRLPGKAGAAVYRPVKHIPHTRL